VDLTARLCRDKRIAIKGEQTGICEEKIHIREWAAKTYLSRLITGMNFARKIVELGRNCQLMKKERGHLIGKTSRSRGRRNATLDIPPRAGLGSTSKRRFAQILRLPRFNVGAAADTFSDDIGAILRKSGHTGAEL